MESPHTINKRPEENESFECTVTSFMREGVMISVLI